MGTREPSNISPPSTTWVWERRKVRAAPTGPAARRAKPGLKSLSQRDPRQPVTITITYRGGAECWWELRARGQIVRLPGHLAVHDVFLWVNGHTPG